jgi:hypothetical protein
MTKKCCQALAGRGLWGPARAALRVFGGMHSGIYRATGGRAAGGELCVAPRHRVHNLPVKGWLHAFGCARHRF